MPVAKETLDGHLSTGIIGLDRVLGGYSRGGMFLIEGAAGTGKTMLALAFAVEGAERGESVLYVTLSESKCDLTEIARIHGWDLSKVLIVEPETDSKYTLFHPAEVELAESIRRLKEEAEKTKPVRVVIDSLAELRLITDSSLRYRRELASLKRFFSRLSCTVLLLDEIEPGDAHMENRSRSLVDGLIVLEQLAQPYKGERRRLQVMKYRGHSYGAGYHDFCIRHGGLQIFPRLVAAGDRQPQQTGLLASGMPEIDSMLGGGIAGGTSTLLLGPAGAGKSSIGLLFAVSAANRGHRAAIYTFDERPAMILMRAASLGMPLQEHVDAGRIHIRALDAVELAPDEFTHDVREEVEGRGVAVVVIDSLNGYIQTMPDEHSLVSQMHELLAYLGGQGVNSFLVMGQSGIFGLSEPASTSYLTDNILLLRFFEAEGEVRRCIAVVKKRTGGHELTIREIRFAEGGIHVGDVLRQFQGVLSGVPTFTGASSHLIKGPDDERPA